MKTCVKCNAQLEDNAIFCPNCGTKQEVVAETPVAPAEPVAPQAQAYEAPAFNAAPEMNAAPQMNQAPKKSKKKLAIILTISILVVIAAIVTTIILVIKHNNAEELKRKTIDLSKYVNVEEVGYDGYGRMAASIDAEKLRPAIYKAMDTTEKKADAQTVALVNKFVGYMTCDIDTSNENLSSGTLKNGDDVVVLISYSKKAAKKLDIVIKNASYKHEMKKLGKVKKVNPFDYITFTTSGRDGHVSVNYEKDTSEEFMEYLYLDYDYSYGLSIGDSVTYKIEDYYVEEAVREYGVKFTETEYTYTVDKADHYLAKLDDISDDLWTEIESMIADKMDDYDMNEDNGYTDFTKYGSVFLYDEEDRENELYVFYKGTYTHKDKAVTIYTGFLIQDLEELADGTQQCYDYVGFDSDYDYDMGGTIYGFADTKELFDETVGDELDSYWHDFEAEYDSAMEALFGISGTTTDDAEATEETEEETTEE